LIQKVSALGSRVGWTPAHKERTNKFFVLKLSTKHRARLSLLSN